MEKMSPEGRYFYKARQKPSRVVAVYNLEYHQPWEYVPLINCYEVYEITSDVETESLNDVKSMRFEDITAVTRKIILHWYMTSVVCPKDGGRISPRNVGTFYQSASVIWQKMVINIWINDKISPSFIEVNQAFRWMRCSLNYSYLTSLSLRCSIVFVDPWLDRNTLPKYLSTAFRVRDLTPSTSTITIVAYIRTQFPTICLDAIKGSTKNLPLWPAPRAIFEFGTALV